MVAQILPTLFMEDPAAEFIPIRLPSLQLEHPSDAYVIADELGQSQLDPQGRARSVVARGFIHNLVCSRGARNKPPRCWQLNEDMHIVRTRISSRRGTRARVYATRLGSVHLPGDARRTHVRRSRHLPFYNPKVEGRQVTRV
ncbi:hypothetical protein CRG98_013679 [Punica granatum]|uniref:Uncharacterized protein n=1 Tax=Punica granatum TaxID=22663 RepID=A0A2I0KCK9_PUNGR|nr:hypothetical protein CRG98_013679 [Punica granatum]